jgi:hypothetical protein
MNTTQKMNVLTTEIKLLIISFIIDITDIEYRENEGVISNAKRYKNVYRRNRLVTLNKNNLTVIKNKKHLRFYSSIKTEFFECSKCDSECKNIYNCWGNSILSDITYSSKYIEKISIKLENTIYGKYKLACILLNFYCTL